MCLVDSEELELEWEPEALPLMIELDSPPPRHDDAQEPDQRPRVIVIDLT